GIAVSVAGATRGDDDRWPTQRLESGGDESDPAVCVRRSREPVEEVDDRVARLRGGVAGRQVYGEGERAAQRVGPERRFPRRPVSPSGERESGESGGDHTDVIAAVCVP